MSADKDHGRWQRLQSDPADGTRPTSSRSIGAKERRASQAPSGIFSSARNPNAARLFQNCVHSIEAQQLLVEFTGEHSVHAQVVTKPGRKKLSEIKLIKDDPTGVEQASEEIKARYAQYFHV